MFSGGRKELWATVNCAFLPPLAVFGKIQMHTIQIRQAFCLALIAVLYKLGLPDLCATGRLFKLRGYNYGNNTKVLYLRSQEYRC